MRYTDDVKPEDLVAFARRDWAGIAASKEAQWLTERRRRGVAWCIEIADTLRRQAVLQHPGWPTVDDRQADIDTHIRVGSALRRVRYPGHH